MLSEEKLARLNEYVDTEEALKRLMGSKAVFKKVLATYKNNSYAEKLIEDHNKGDIEEAVNSAHTLKGVAANLSLKKIHELSVKIEASLKSGSLCPEMIAELDPEDKATREYIDYLEETL